MAAIGLTVTVSAAPAQADGYIYPQNAATKLCLDDSDLNIRGFGCNHLSYQKWYDMEWADGTYRWKNAATQLCMRDFGNGVVAHAACDTSEAESWYTLISTQYGGITLENQATGMCLDDSVIGLRTFQCNELAYQVW
jgi:hypothetical protein